MRAVVDPLERLFMMVPVVAPVDGPTEVHQVTVARQLLGGVEPHGTAGG